MIDSTKTLMPVESTFQNTVPQEIQEHFRQFGLVEGIIRRATEDLRQRPDGTKSNMMFDRVNAEVFVGIIPTG